jgi:coenzyme PQQ precursor peptide PqqA
LGNRWGTRSASALLSTIAIAAISISALSRIAMLHIGARLIYKFSSVGIDRLASIVACTGHVKEESMTWTTPTLVEICIGLEINGYLPAEF